MSEQIKVGMADYKLGKSPDRLITLGLGSCIGITIYAKKIKAGGMAHIMLPKNNDPEKRSWKFADIAIEDMINELSKLGIKISEMEAKIAGGARMFSFNTSDEKSSIGYRNAVSVKQILAEMNIKIISEDVGGTMGRTIELDLENGDLKIKTIGQDIKII
jgi:chemotaxis protein CheD